MRSERKGGERMRGSEKFESRGAEPKSRDGRQEWVTSSRGSLVGVDDSVGSIARFGFEQRVS